jgi:peptide-methionine (S)-S-oxide reductase
VRIFFRIHDPTTIDRQGPDVGDQYRSAVFTFSDAQAGAVRSVIAEVQPGMPGRIVTQVAPIGRFWIAEGYHQQYAERTGHHGCPTGSIDDLL